MRDITYSVPTSEPSQVHEGDTVRQGEASLEESVVETTVAPEEAKIKEGKPTETKLEKRVSSEDFLRPAIY